MGEIAHLYPRSKSITTLLAILFIAFSGTSIAINSINRLRSGLAAHRSFGKTGQAPEGGCPYVVRFSNDF